MYQTYFGIEENPFSLTPDPRYLYMAKGHREALAHLLYGVSEGGGFVLLSGEVGTGKTSICRALLEQMPEEAEVALVLNPRLSEFELLATICDELGVDQPRTSSLKQLVDGLNQTLLRLHGEGRRAVLILDEAQNLSPSVLEQLRLLTNLETAKHKLLQIILIGQPELLEMLSRKELRQLAQRITARYHLNPLNALDARAYIAHRLKIAGLPEKTFSPAARSEVYKRSRGVPRLINSLCDRCLLAAYVQETRRIDQRMVRDAAGEVFGQRMPVRARRRAVLPGALALAAASFVAVVLIEPREITMSEVVPSAAQLPALAAATMASAGSLLELDFLPAAIGGTIVSDAGVLGRAAPGDETAPADDGLALRPAAGSLLDEMAVADLQPAEAEFDSPAMGSLPELPAAQVAALPDRAAAQADPADLPEPDLAEPDLPELAVAEPALPEPVLPQSVLPQSDLPQSDLPQSDLPQSDLPQSDLPEPVLPRAAAPAAVQPATGPALTELLAARATAGAAAGDEEAALGRLFALWGRDYRLLAGRDACERALWAGLRCLSGRADLSYLKAIDRPALLSLVTPTGSRVPAVLMATDGAQLTLALGDREVRVEAVEMAPVWTGDYMLLWQPPEGYQRYLKRGDHGRDVAWLMRRLAEINGLPAEVDLEATFGTALEAQVVVFQRDHGLHADGIVGPRTLIELNNIAATNDETALVAEP